MPKSERRGESLEIGTTVSPKALAANRPKIRAYKAFMSRIAKYTANITSFGKKKDWILRK